MNLSNDFENRELSTGELETVAAGFIAQGFFGSLFNPVVNELQLTMGYRYHPPLPGGGPTPFGGPHRV